MNPPTSLRHWIVLTAMLAAVLLYLERVCLSVAEVFIREDIGIDKDQMALVFGAFFFAYALGQVPSGWLSQRYGPRLMMTLYMMGWSLFGVFIALAQDFTTLFASRFLLGLSQAGAYPTAALLVKRWVPDRSRGLASSIVAFGGRFGGAGANWLTGILIVAFVPMTISGTLTPADILNPDAIHTRLKPQPGDSGKPEFFAGVLPQIREQLHLPAADETLSVEILVTRLNLLLAQPNLFESVDPRQVPLPSDGKAILKKPALDRTPEEIIRLNRLYLERLFPGGIRQLHVAGWRPTLLLYGVLGIVVGLLFWVVARDYPRDHPWINEEEKNLIERGQLAAGQTAGTDSIPLMLLMKSRNQWYFSLNQVFSNIGWVFLITLMPRFLEEKYGVPVEERGLMTTIPIFIAAFGMIVGGWTTDKLTARYGKKIGRSVPFGIGKLPCVVALAMSPFLPTAWAVVIALTIMAVAQDFGIPAVWAFAQDTGGKQVGAVIGWANMWGNFGAGLAPLIMRVIEKSFGWDGVLVFGSISFLLCAVAGMLCNANISLFPAPESSATSPDR